MTRDDAAAASKHLRQAWQSASTFAELPAQVRPRSRTEGYAIQAILEEHDRRVGWKIAATSVAGQRHINVDGPIAGRLLSRRVHGNGATLPLAGNFMRVCEPEFAFRMARPLVPRPEPYTVAEVLAAVGELCPAIELPSSRFTDFTAVGAAALIADNACAHDAVIGTPTTVDWRSIDLSRHPATAIVMGEGSKEERRFDGSGANVLGDPRVALTWLANELRANGVTLDAGEVIITGTCVTPVPVNPGDRFTADFGVLGQVTVSLSA